MIELISFQRIDETVRVMVYLVGGTELETIVPWDHMHETFFHMAAQNPMEFIQTPMIAAIEEEEA